MSVSSIALDPDAVIDVAWDWTAWLADGETIISQTVTPSSANVTVGSVTATSTVVTAWLSDGVDGSTVQLTCHIETSQGREDDRTLTAKVNER